MDNLENYCFRISRSQCLSELRTSRGNYDTMSILRGVALSSRPFIATQIIWILLDGVL